MSLTDKKVSDALLQTGVVSAPDKLTGTAAENKAVFDRLIRNIVAQCLNPVLDELAGRDGAAAVGGRVEGMAAVTVQGLLAALKGLCDNCYTKDEADTLVGGQTGNLLSNAELDKAGVWTFTRKDGTRIVYDTKLEKIAVNFKLDGDYLVLAHDDGTEERVSIAAFRDHHQFADSDAVFWSYTGEENNRTFTASVKANSITLEMLALDAVGKIEGDVSDSAQNAKAAQEAREGAEAAKADVAANAARAAASAQAAKESEENAVIASGSAADSARASEIAKNEGVAQMDQIRVQTQAIRDSTEITPYVDDSEDTGYRVGFKRADEAAAKWTPPLQAQVSVGDVTTAPAGGFAYVQERGSPSRRVLDFSIPRGEQGPPGERGKDAVVADIGTGVFALVIDDDGNLCVDYADGAQPPQMGIDENNNLWIEV